MSTGASSPSSESASASDSPSSAASDAGVIGDRIEAVVNQKYKKSGIQSYVWLLQKCKDRLLHNLLRRVTKCLQTTSDLPSMDLTSDLRVMGVGSTRSDTAV